MDKYLQYVYCYKTGYLSRNVPEDSLVPYVLSDSTSSEELIDLNDMVSSGDEMEQVAGATPVRPSHYREYNNNTTCPKVRTKPFDGDRRFGAKNIEGFGDCTPDGYQGTSFTDEHTALDTTDFGESRRARYEMDTESRKTKLEMESDISNWIAAAVERDLEDKLLEKLESQLSGTRLEDDLADVLDQKKLMAQSAAALCSWEQEGRKSNSPAPNSGGRVHSPQFRDKMVTLQEMCQERLKSALRSAYNNSPHYWDTYQQSLKLTQSKSLCCSSAKA